jgi:hypothetical protein
MVPASRNDQARTPERRERGQTVDESESRTDDQQHIKRLRRRLRRQGLLLRKVRIPRATPQQVASYVILDAETKIAVGMNLSLADVEQWIEEE